jgi:hypothetical protein
MNVSPQVPRSRHPRPATASSITTSAYDHAVPRPRNPRVLIQVPDLNTPTRPIAIPTNTVPSLAFGRHVTPTRAAATLGMLVVAVGMVLMTRGGNEDTTPDTTSKQSQWVGTPGEAQPTGKFAAEGATATSTLPSRSQGVHLQATSNDRQPSSSALFQYQPSFAAPSSAPDLVGPELNQSSRLDGVPAGYSTPLGTSQAVEHSQYAQRTYEATPSMAKSHPGAAMFGRDAGTAYNGYGQSGSGQNDYSQAGYGPTSGYTASNVGTMGRSDANVPDSAVPVSSYGQGSYQTASRPEYPAGSTYQSQTSTDYAGNYSSTVYPSNAQNAAGQAGFQGNRSYSGTAYQSSLPAEVPAARFQGTITR